MIGTRAWRGLDAIRRWRWIAVGTVVAAMTASLVSQTLVAQTLVSQSGERAGRITEEVDGSRLVALPGNVRQDLTAERDLGPVEDAMPLRLYLVLARSPEQQADLENLVARQQQTTAPEYHQWLTPGEFGARFGASPADIAKITAWLEAQGMRVNGVMNNQTFIDFSTTAGQVREVFQTPLHYWNIRGGKYAANAGDPMIPAALAGVVSSIKGLSKIPPVAMHTKPGQASYDAATHGWKKAASGSGPSGLRASPAYNNGIYDGFEEYDVTPQDYYTIYHVNQVFSGNANVGAGATVAVIEESDFEYGTVNSSTGAATGGDLATFRSLFGVPGRLNLHVYHGYGSVTCNDPGIDPEHEGEESEAAMDSEWANALAPSANLIVMSCDQSPDQGTFTAMAALIDNNLADAMSLSYGESEIGYSAAEFSAQDALYEEAAAQGQSIVVASGDGGSDVKDWVKGANTAVSGYNVNAYGAPTVTVAGGTDFSDLYDWSRANFAQASNCEDGSATCTSWGSAYWGNTNTGYGDALGYVPETAWNDSCAGSLVSYVAGPYYTGAEYCAGLTASYIDGTLLGGSGGFSTHYAVPAYQSGIAGYSGSMRAQPDVSGFASNGYWNHALIFCDSYSNASDPNAPGSDGLPVTNCASSGTFGSAGGTSFVAPSLAGIAGLLRSATGSRQGLLNPALYALAKAQFTAPATGSACYANGQSSNLGVTAGLPNSACIFNDVTTGNNDVPCAAGSLDCYVNESGARFGMLSLNGAGSLQTAYPSTVGYDEATGIGTLNVYNLITKWNTAFPSTTALTANPMTIAVSGSTVLSATVTTSAPEGATYTPAANGTVSFNAGSTALGSCILNGTGCTLTVNGSALENGANSITATFVSGSYATSTSSTVTVSVGASLTAQTITFAQPATQSYGVGSITLAATASSGLAVSYAVVSGPGTVSGSTLNITGAGSIVVQATQAGNGSYAAATPVSVTVMVNPAVLTVTANNASLVSGQPLPSFSYTIAGYVNGDTSAVVSGTATLTTTATSSSPAGSYPISFATELLTASNYTFRYVSGTLTISGLTAQTITFAQPARQSYGVGSITLAATASSGLAVSYAVVSGPGTVSGSTLNITGAGSIVVQATQAGNGSYAAATPVSVTVMVNPAVLTVTANNASLVSGQPLPSFSYTIAGYVNGDTSAVVSGTATLTTTATSSSPAGSYPISFATELLTASNYTFRYVSGTLTISGLTAQTITFAQPATQSYGVGSITLAATASSGLAVSYAVVSGPGTVSGSTLNITGAGSIVVQATQAGNGSYAAATPVSVTVMVIPAVLTVTANNASMVSGQPLPSFSYTIAGYVNGDTSAVVSGTATLTTTATSSSPAGSYPISFATELLTASNYTFRYVSGTLTISSAAVLSYSVTANPTTLTIPQGQSGTTTITLTGSNGYDGTVSFSCGGLPAGMSCGFAPASLTAPADGSAVTSVLTVTTRAAAAGLDRGSSHPMLAVYGTMSCGIFGWVLAGGGARRRRRWTRIGLMVLALALGFAMTGCGAGGSSGGSTPPSSSVITVSAVASANGPQPYTTTQTLLLTINVTQ